MATLSVITSAIFLFNRCSMQENLIFFPEKLPADYKLQFPWPFEEMHIKSGGALLHALYFPVKNPNGCIIYFHGNAGSLRTWGFIAEDFISRKYDLAILDYRGYGKSEGKIKNEKMLHEDAENFYLQVMKRCPGGKTVIYGRSIGSGIASALALKHRPDMLILESPYTSIPDLASFHYSIVPKFFVKYKLNVLDDVRNLTCPLVIFHGTEDNIIPLEMSKKISSAANEKHKLILIEGGGHNDLSTFTEYQKNLNSALK